MKETQKGTAPETFEFVEPDCPRPGYRTAIRYEVRPGGLTARSLLVESDTLPVTARVVREVAAERLMRNDHLSRKGTPRSPTGAKPAPIDPEGVAELVRDTYLDAVHNGLPPAVAVSEALGVSLATAGRRIRASKDELAW